VPRHIDAERERAKSSHFYLLMLFKYCLVGKQSVSSAELYGCVFRGLGPRISGQRL